MVLRSERKGAEPTEEAPLLRHNNTSNEASSFDSVSTVTSTSIPAVPGGNENVKTSIDSGDEEGSVGRGDIEENGESGRRHVAKIISVLLIGIFVAHTDGSIMLATHPIIASEFDKLSSSSWLITSFALAGAATQTLYGKLSDIYGRKPLVLISYIIFIVGCAIVGIGQSMWQVVLGRVISGAGASGMTVLVSVLITDLLPIREVAQWRAYVNLVATLGRSIGGPLGGWLSDVIGWRWSFLGQVPILTLAIVLCTIYLPGHHSEDSAIVVDEPPTDDSKNKSKFSRIDFKGSFTFALMVLALLLPISIGGVNLPWSHPIIPSLFILSGLLLVMFITVEKRQEEPILPLEIFHQRDAVLSFLIMGLQTAAQLGLMFSVPLYFQITARASNTVAGAHLVPAVVGNAIGGVISGLLIKRSGRYKTLVVFAVICSSISYLLLMLRWHGNTNWWESLYIFPSGFGTGIAQSAVFISLQVVVDPAHMAPAISFMYLTTTVWLTIGLPVSNSIMQTALRWTLQSRLLALGFGATEIQQILSDALSDVDYVDHATRTVSEAVVASYVDGLFWSHGFSFFCSFSAFIIALFVKQRRLGTSGR
ncbi:major facilitator superfamily domain-containing protein [Apodospora peruviana]|uniref:Major facilitator superfamily domain-containing protein n=1 Tax=Apodospora peruviana TaxID=516989 RepID=A0AAE0IBD5_9PEZI|nr:major facilitator superfamily domain-containing protein [Apodospora peruviana]